MRGNQGFWVGIVLSFVAACGQELVVPESSKPQKTKAAENAPDQGFTGAGGAADEASTKPRLPVAEEPIFTTFGGAGGDASTPGGAGGDTLETESSGAGGKPGSSGGSFGGSDGGGSAVAGAGGAPSGPAALLFSEYVEGTGSFKALEIYALEASSLEGCELLTYSNGKLEPARLALHGQLARGDVHVLCSSALATALPNACNRSTNLNFNGDDALALSCEGRVLDVVGEIGVDPGDSWGTGATLDHTLRRRCEVTMGRSGGDAPFAIDAEWLTLGADTFSDLGVRNCAP
jgi:hypothetical protein